MHLSLEKILPRKEEPVLEAKTSFASTKMYNLKKKFVRKKKRKERERERASTYFKMSFYESGSIFLYLFIY